MSDELDLDTAASEDTNESPVLNRNNPRDEFLKGLADRHADENESELIYDDEDTEDESTGGNEVDQEDVEDVKPVQKHKIKVNGKELDLTYEELVERAQKVEAADEYLRTAKQIAEQQEFNQPSDEDVGDKVEDVDDLALVRALQMGTEEEAIAALKQIKKSQTPQVTKEEILREVEERAKVTSAAQKFANDFPDIFNDHKLRKLAFEEDTRLMNSGDRRPYEERYTDIGNSIRGWVKSIATTATTSDKVQRKINAPTVPKASGRTKSVDAESGEESRESVLAKMRSARGQQT